MTNNKLGMIDFIANHLYMYQQPFSYRVRWLCSSKEHQKEWKDKAHSLFEEWKCEEIKWEEVRKRINNELG